MKTIRAFTLICLVLYLGCATAQKPVTSGDYKARSNKRYRDAGILTGAALVTFALDEDGENDFKSTALVFAGAALMSAIQGNDDANKASQLMMLETQSKLDSLAARADSLGQF